MKTSGLVHPDLLKAWQNRARKAEKKCAEFEDALRYCRAEAQRHKKTPAAWAPAVIDRVDAALKEGSYAKAVARAAKPEE